MPHLVVVAGESGLELRHSGHTDHGVLYVVCLEEGLEDLAGTQGVHIRVGQHQHVLTGTEEH